MGNQLSDKVTQVSYLLRGWGFISRLYDKTPAELLSFINSVLGFTPQPMFCRSCGTYLLFFYVLYFSQ